MEFYFSLLEIYKSEEQWWFGFFGVTSNINYGNKYLFYIERDNGYWKFDLLFLREWFLDFKEKGE